MGGFFNCADVCTDMGGRVTGKDMQVRGAERRGGDPVLNAIGQLQASLDKRHVENVRNIEAGAADIKEVKDQLRRVLAGFPDGDPEGHCRYHEEVMSELEERKKLWREIRAHILKGGAWAVVGGVLWGAWKLFEFYLEKRL